MVLVSHMLILYIVVYLQQILIDLIDEPMEEKKKQDNYVSLNIVWWTYISMTLEQLNNYAKNYVDDLYAWMICLVLIDR